MVAAARGGDRLALDALWRRHRRWVAGVLLAHKPHGLDVEDLLQDVAMTLVGKIKELRDEASFPGWLRMVALNAARAAGRTTTRHREATPKLRLVGETREAAGVEETDPVASKARDEEARRLMALAQELPAEYREPLLLKSIRGMTYRQIGELLDLPETTVETRICRGRRMLRDLAQEAIVAAERA
jgi:RNA polymerase sigma-70 factor, ECF subfamily